ncbi:hypothetical protein QN362_03625 [Actimicrobium sp. CCC2.4]|uniref:hypothetical protein n=1 Tax=Actimicrobium sp. CCC2.4 TaxID=3048606 RepID=UPI002AC8EB3E|nr:hypothetical protein [Actimicrobium sp. CCC2.4]MEB0134416.1 hypothetical protein [Actimicrobium sp. CCC2.4]WPX33052.1 hypothetical protein RHM62_04190 [Actimicrobium sp. CCC2.4]
MDKESEQALAAFTTVNGQIIKGNIAILRTWMQQQSAADMQDTALSAVQRAMATRVFKRTTQTGTIEERAFELELDSYFCDARVLREIVPHEVLNLYDIMEAAACNLMRAREYTAELERS